MNLQNFMHGKRWWDKLAGGDIYMRHSTRLHPVTAEHLRCIDLANVELPEDRRGRGAFSIFLTELEEAVSQSDQFDAVYVENVMNERLAVFLIIRGYAPIPNTRPPCFLHIP
jgi:hypothetical protein